MKKRLLIIFLFLLLVACTPQYQIPAVLEGELTTEDNIEIAYTYNEVTTDKAVILLHMLNRNRYDWNVFSVKLNQNNFSTLAIDLRGHGESQGNWEEFSEQDFNNIILDIKAAKEFLEKENYTEIYIVGASIGANTALKYASTDNEIKKIVLLSPSDDYRGVTTLDIVNDYEGEILIITGSKDESSYEGSLLLNNTFTGEKELLVYDTKNHGTTLLLNYNEINNKIVEFLKN